MLHSESIRNNAFPYKHSPSSSVIMKVWLNKKKSLFRLKTTLDKKWPFKHSFNETKSENLGNYSYYINTFPSESLIVELYIYILLHRALKFQKSQEWLYMGASMCVSCHKHAYKTCAILSYSCFLVTKWNSRQN